MDADAFLEHHRARRRAELAAFVAFPSISAQSERAGDMRDCVAWLAARVTAIGLQEVTVHETGGHPILTASWLHAGPGAPTVLLYGHYDVQPPDPLEAWTSPPFLLQERGGLVYGRGSADNKGMILTHLHSVEALLATEGALPVNLRLIVEGEEETVSDNLAAFCATHRDLLAADVCMNSDSGQLGPTLPGVVVGLRGLVGLTIALRTAARDLHSGKFGGVAPNAAQALVELLAGLHHPDGRVAVAGFYDGILPPAAGELEAWARIPIDDAYFLDLMGARAVAGEPGRPALERLWARPCLDVNGIWGGYQGEGMKTVIPAVAHAKLSARLVPGQDADTILALIRDHLMTHCPPQAELVFEFAGAGGQPTLTPQDHPAVRAALEALGEAFEAPALVLRMGWSVPAVEIIRREAGVASVLVGFGYPDAGEHAPNEHVAAEALERGARAMVRFWRRCASGWEGR